MDLLPYTPGHNNANLQKSLGSLHLNEGDVMKKEDSMGNRITYQSNKKKEMHSKEQNEIGPTLFYSLKEVGRKLSSSLKMLCVDGDDLAKGKDDSDMNSLKFVTNSCFVNSRKMLHPDNYISEVPYISKKSYFSSSRSLHNRLESAYPVRCHEMVFLPDFPIKGLVTEGNFEVVDIVARGAFGNVIKVREKSTSNIYALKIMSKSQIIRDRAIQQVKDEAFIARSMSSHPFIVTTYYYWQSKRYLYLLSEYVPYGELLHLWAKFRPLNETVVRVYVAEVGIVLDYLHNNGIIYRDLKMENILLDQKGHIQLTDFGLSKPLKLGARTNTICGTLQYIAPEVLTVSPYDHAVDWWSLGILAYALLVGAYPYKATNDHISMANRVLNSSINLNCLKCSAAAKEVLKKLLDRNPNTRLKSLDRLRKLPFLQGNIEKLLDKRISVLQFL